MTGVHCYFNDSLFSQDYVQLERGNFAQHWAIVHCTVERQLSKLIGTGFDSDKLIFG
jgi:hypothetical protein